MTLEGVEGIISLPDEVAVINGLIDKPTELIEAWEGLTELEIRARAAKSAVSALRLDTQSSSMRPNRIHGYFEEVASVSDRFEYVMWNSFRASMYKGREGAPHLVRIMQVSSTFRLYG